MGTRLRTALEACFIKCGAVFGAPPHSRRCPTALAAPGNCGGGGGLGREAANSVTAPRAPFGVRSWSLHYIIRRRDGTDVYFLFICGLWPAGVLPDENGDGVAPPFLMFLSALGFFFSLLLRI